MREVATLREINDRLFESQAGRDEGNQYDLAGIDEAGFQGEHAIMKPPETGEPTSLGISCEMTI